MRIGKITWIALGLVAVLAFFAWNMVRGMLDVAAVQDCLNRDWETYFDPQIEAGTGRPPILPVSIDDAVQGWLNRRYAGNPRGLDFGRGPEHAKYRDNVYHERIRALFRGTIREIEIADPEGFRGDPGAALKRFPGLRRLTVHDCGNNDGPTAAEWQLLCERLRSLPELEEIDLAGRFIADPSVAPLAGHPALRTIRIRCSSLTPGCAKTFRSIPGLATIYLNVWPDPRPEDQARWSAELPGAVINDPKNTP